MMQSQSQEKWRSINEFSPVLRKFLGNVNNNLAAQTASDVVNESEKISEDSILQIRQNES